MAHESDSQAQETGPNPESRSQKTRSPSRRKKNTKGALCFVRDFLFPYDDEGAHVGCHSADSFVGFAVRGAFVVVASAVRGSLLRGAHGSNEEMSGEVWLLRHVP